MSIFLFKDCQIIIGLSLVMINRSFVVTPLSDHFYIFTLLLDLTIILSRETAKACTLVFMICNIHLNIHFKIIISFILLFYKKKHSRVSIQRNAKERHLTNRTDTGDFFYLYLLFLPFLSYSHTYTFIFFLNVYIYIKWNI